MSRNPVEQPLAIPDYQLLQRIGRGSYGEVWLARSATGTLRALKIVWRHTFDDDRPFQREFEGIQCFERLSRGDPSQLALFHVGRGEGYFFYVMELADPMRPEISNQCSVNSKSVISQPATGASALVVAQEQLNTDSLNTDLLSSYHPHTLRADLAHGRLPAARVLEIALTLTSALHDLHKAGLVHRDIKPSNIIFVNGRPKLADIGLVTDSGDARSIVGTEGYLAPEGPGAPQADLFALGKVLYEAATGLDRRQFPQLPSDLREWPDATLIFELNEILLKACAPNARERYSKAEAMRAEMALLQRGESVRRQRVWQRNLNHTKKFGFAIISLAIMSAIVYSLMVWRPSQHESVWSKDEKANDAYRNGIIAFHQDAEDSFDVAAKHFERAIEIDPDFARAHARLANAYIWMDPSDPKNLLKARPHAEKALMLDPKLDEAYNAVAGIKTLLLRDWSGAEKDALKAIRLNPNSDDNYYAYAGLLSMVARTNEAIQQVEKALRVDSRSFVSQQFAAFVFLDARQYDRAIGIINNLTNRQPTSRARLTEDFLVPAYLNKGDYLTAIDLERQAALLRGKAPDQVKARHEALLKAYHEDGGRGYWQRVLDWKKNDESAPVQLAIFYARVGDKGMAFHYLDLALAETPPTRLTFVINRDPGFDNLRGDPHFTGILKNLGFRQ